MRISQIWRYPVKSMQGEQLAEANVGPAGLEGDREWAVVDAESGVSLSAKRYKILLECHAWTSDSGVMIRLPDGSEHAAGSDAAAAALSALLERPVVTRTAAATDKIQHEFPTGVSDGTGDPFLHEPETEAFFDSAQLHLLTTSTLAKFEQLLPESSIHHARYRPNFIVDGAATGFIENEWVGTTINVGSLPCDVFDDMRRCVMVTHPQGELGRDIEVLRIAASENKRAAGVAMKALDVGRVRTGDEISLSG